MPILGINRRGGEAQHQGTSPAGSVPAGKTDLLLRFFDSHFFDEWIALTYLYKSNSPGVQDYLCNRLYTLPEAGLERYLSQLCQLIISRPYSPLEKVVVDLCARSLRFAVKTYWLLLAISQDQPKNKYVSDLRDRCERAALEGSWEPPFRETKLLPLSPPRARGWLRSSPISPTVSLQPPTGKLRAHAVERANGNGNGRWGSPDPFLPGDRPPAWGPPGGVGALSRPMSPDAISRPTSPDGLGGGLYSSYTMGTGLEGLICASPSAVRDRPPRGVTPLQIARATDAERAEARSLSADRRRKLRLDLGDSEGVSTLLENSLLGAEGGQPGVVVAGDNVADMSPPSSPRLRQTTFGATLDFIEALCDASSGLTSFAPEDREWALRNGLDEINKEIEAASRNGVACWFPMGTRNERIVRLATKEALLLNSREKAPFMLLIEVLSNDEGSVIEDAKYSAGSDAAATLSRPAGSRGKTVPRPYTPPGGAKPNAADVPGAEVLEQSPLAETSPVRTLDFEDQPGPLPRIREAGSQPSTDDPLAAVDIELPELAAPSDPASPSGMIPRSVFADSGHESAAESSPDAPSVSAAPAMDDLPTPSAAQPTSLHRRRQVSPADDGDDSAASTSVVSRPQQKQQQQHRRPLPLDIPGGGARGADHSAVVGSPTTTAPIVAQIRRSRSTDAEAPAELNTASSGGLRLGPSALVRAVGRALRSVVGGDSDDAPVPLAASSSAEAATAVANAAAAAAAAGIGPAGDANEEARSLRLRQAIMGDTAGAADGVSAGASGTQDVKAIDSPSNSFSRGLQSALAGLRGTGPLVSVTLEVLGDVSRDAGLASTSAEACQCGTRCEPGLPPRAPHGAGVKRSESKESVATGARALTMLCHWGTCKTKEDDGSPGPYVRVRLKVHGGVDLRLAARPSPNHRRIPSDEALMRMAAYHRAPLPVLPTLSSPPSSPAPSQTLPQSAVTAALDSMGKQSSPRKPLRERVNGTDAAAAEATTPEDAACPAHASSADAETEPLQASSAAATDAEEAAAQARAVYGERFADKARRVQAQSPHGRRPGWAVRPIIVKSGDDCRQELLAAQLIQALADIFRESALPLYLRPYEVLVTSNRTALIELVPDSLSVHTIKAKSPPGSALSDHFFAKFGRGTPACLAAQRAFAESMAGYSIACYLLQIKDRHNGNILLDDAGHLIHIDFGFMLSNSPGGVNFEAAPFKLTRELLEIMDSTSEGLPSEMFDYYKVLCIQGFLAARKHADRIILLVEMMANSGCPCFKAGARAVHNLRKRFHLNLTETQCVEVVLAMIADSLDAWRTRQYDYYQRVLNGIL